MAKDSNGVVRNADVSVNCFAVCIEGGKPCRVRHPPCARPTRVYFAHQPQSMAGPVTRVENLMMDEIVSNVKVKVRCDATPLLCSCFVAVHMIRIRISVYRDFARRACQT